MGRLGINSSIVEEIRAELRPEDKPTTIEEIIEVKKPEEETTLNWNDLVKEELRENISGMENIYEKRTVRRKEKE